MGQPFWLLWGMRGQSQKEQVSKWVDRLLESDKEAFAHLFNVLWPSNYNYALSIIVDKEVAEDIVQEVWIYLWQNRKKIVNTHFEAYVHTCVRNMCYKHLRDNKLQRIHQEVLEDLSVEAEATQKANLEALNSSVDQQLDKLQPRCQEIFRLSRFEQLSNEEIAQMFGISKHSVQNQLSLALKTMRYALKVLLPLASFIGHFL